MGTPTTTFMKFIEKPAVPGAELAKMPAASMPGTSSWQKAIDTQAKPAPTQPAIQPMTLGAGIDALANWHRAIAPAKP